MSAATDVEVKIVQLDVSRFITGVADMTWPDGAMKPVTGGMQRPINSAGTPIGKSFYLMTNPIPIETQWVSNTRITDGTGAEVEPNVAWHLDKTSESVRMPMFPYKVLDDKDYLAAMTLGVYISRYTSHENIDGIILATSLPVKFEVPEGHPAHGGSIVYVGIIATRGD